MRHLVALTGVAPLNIGHYHLFVGYIMMIIDYDKDSHDEDDDGARR